MTDMHHASVAHPLVWSQIAEPLPRDPERGTPVLQLASTATNARNPSRTLELKRSGGDVRYRRFGRSDWEVSEVGYGMWGMGEWTGSDDEKSLTSLQAAVDRGCTFFDTAWSYGEGRSERLLGALLRANPGRRLYAATKLPPMDRRWPARRGATLDEVYPIFHIREYAERSLANLGVGSHDLLFFHVWQDDWANDEDWLRSVDELRREGIARSIGISVNRREPDNVVRALRTGLFDAVQVTYNIFEQNPQDVLFPLCRELGIAVVARIPFDEGALTDRLTMDSHWPEGDFRGRYFDSANLRATLERVDALRPLVPPGLTMAQMALRFVLSSPDITTVIPGMRTVDRVDENLSASESGPLSEGLLRQLGGHRWDRSAQT